MLRVAGRARGARRLHARQQPARNHLEVITAAIFIGIALLGQRVWARLHFYEAPANSARVHVLAQQFQWNFHYPGKDGQFGHTDPKLVKDSELNFVGLDEQDPAAKDDQVVTTLVTPVNRPVELNLRSKDVTHSIWVPETRFKQDLVPGLSINVHYTPKETGKYELACAELCGQLHFKMKSYLLVVQEAQFDELIAMPQTQFQKRVTELLAQYPLTIQSGAAGAASR